MKIEAWKSNSGKLFETEQECEIEDLKDKIIEFLLDSPSYYDDNHQRKRYTNDLAKRIVENKTKFLKIFFNGE